MESLYLDIKHSLRALRKAPAFSAVAILTLALGIGAVTAMYAVMGETLFPHLGVRDPADVARLWAINPKLGVERGLVSGPTFLDWKTQASAFEELAGFDSNTRTTLTRTKQPQRLEMQHVTVNYFHLIGARAIVGRLFTPRDDLAGASTVAAISFGLWRDQFGRDPNIVGRILTLDGTNYEIVAVMSEDVGSGLDVWTPLVVSGNSPRTEQRIFVMGRIRAGVSVATAQAELDTIAARLERQYPASNAGWLIRLVPVLEEQYKKAALGLVFFYGSVIAVLLLACMNVANLLMARMSVRATEIAVRSALGATRVRLVRRLLTENLFLAAGGGALGVVLAWWGIFAGRTAMAHFQPEQAKHIAMNVGVLGFAYAVAMATVLIFGIAPTIYATRVNLNDVMKTGGMGGAPYSGLSLNRRPMLILEIALAVPFLVITLLAARGMQNMEERFSSGFEQQNVLTLTVAPSPVKYRDPVTLFKFYADLRNRLSGLPGVEVVGAGDSLPIPSNRWGRGGKSSVQIESGVGITRESGVALTRVTPGYLEAIRVPLLAGKMISQQDSVKMPVAVISQEMAKRLWPGGSALGKRFRNDTEDNPWVTIVGIVGDVGYGKRQPQPAAYISMTPPSSALSFVVRTSADPNLLIEDAKRAVWSVDPEQPLDRVASLKQVFSDDLAGSNFSVTLMGIFGWLAFFLAAIGVYSVTSYSVSQRTSEFGIRIALGADRRDILGMVLRGGAQFALTGIALGSAICWAITRVIVHEFVGMGVSGLQPAMYAATAVLIVFATLIACYMPARRAMRVDPMVALRYE